ncbi:MAG TPA: prepilin peptidase [Solirubrobacterales bacterium]
MAAAAVLAFVGGLLAGSFVTVVAHRVPRGESIVGPRSRCPFCGVQIAAYDNVPVLSWLVLRGRARCCGARISARYPLTELAVAALYATTVLVLWDDWTEVVEGLIFIPVLAAVTLSDLERRIIPNKILGVGALAAVVVAAIGDPGSLPVRLIAGAGAGGILFVAALAYPRGMGLGDVKLAATMGLFLGRNVIPAMFVALLTGSLVGLVIIAREGAAGRKMAIPFGPFLALGGVVGLLLGDQLIDLYLNTFT